jgi:hypothetical protein
VTRSWYVADAQWVGGPVGGGPRTGTQRGGVYEMDASHDRE